MATVEQARVFMRGRSQAVRIPVEFRFASKDVFIRRDPQNGDIILSEGQPPQPLSEIFAMIDVAGGAEELLMERDTTAPQDREWMGRRRRETGTRRCIELIQKRLAIS